MGRGESVPEMGVDKVRGVEEALTVSETSSGVARNRRERFGEWVSRFCSYSSSSLLSST